MCAALVRQRAVNTELRTVIATQAELHQAELAGTDTLIAQLRSQVAATDAQIASLTAIAPRLQHSRLRGERQRPARCRDFIRTA